MKTEEQLTLAAVAAAAVGLIVWALVPVKQWDPSLMWYGGLAEVLAIWLYILAILVSRFSA